MRMLCLKESQRHHCTSLHQAVWHFPVSLPFNSLCSQFLVLTDVRLSRDGVSLTTLSTGSHFGGKQCTAPPAPQSTVSTAGCTEFSLLWGIPQPFTCTTVTRCEIFELPRWRFDALFMVTPFPSRCGLLEVLLLLRLLRCCPRTTLMLCECWKPLECND